MSPSAPSIDAEIDAEQQWFDSVRHERESKREARELAWKVGGNSKDRAALNRGAKRDETLGSPDDEVAFLRIDAEDGDAYYVGKNSVMGLTGDQLIYSWRVPAILAMRAATHDDSRGVARHRQFRTRPVNQISALEDIIFVELARKVAELAGGEATLLETDRQLQAVLERGRTPEMEDIVRTIQAAQSDIIAAPAAQLMIVQGGPGTGKTAVALHRVAALLFNELRDVDHDDVLVVGPNPTFLRYIARVLPELGERNVAHIDINRLMNASVTASVKEQPEAARLKGDSRMVEVLARGLQERVRPVQDDVQFSLDAASWKVLLTADAAREILEDIDLQPYVTGRVKFRAAVESRILREARRQNRAGARDSHLRPIASEVEAYVERVWPQLTPQAFLRDLYGSLERLVAASAGSLAVDDLQLLRRQAAARLGEQVWSKEDLPLLDHLSYEMTGDGKTFAHIAVDEAQDLTPMQLLAIRRRSRDGAMTIVGDIAQSTGQWARDSWDDIAELLASPLPRTIEHLRYGYRVPRAVMELAARLLAEAAPGIQAPTVVTDVDRPPQWREVARPDDLVAAAVSAVQVHSAKGLFVGVICPDLHREALAAALDTAEINWTDADKGGLAAAINVVSPTSSKGLEFDAAVVIDPAAIVAAGPHGLRMLYIALTRTTGYLDLVHVAGDLPVQLMTTSDEVGNAGVPETPVPETPGSDHELERTSPAAVPRHSTEPKAEASAPGAQATRLRAAGGGSKSSPRRGVVTFTASQVVEMLEEIAPKHLWLEILDAARERLANDESPS